MAARNFFILGILGILEIVCVCGRVIQLDPLNSDTTVSRGERLSLRCLQEFDGHITWYKDNEVLLHSSVRVKVMKQTLKIKYFESRDAGTYGCLIEKNNDYNQTIEWRNVTLRVEEALQNDGYREDDGKIGNVLRPRDETNELELEARNLPETRSLHLDSEKSDAELDNNKGENEMVDEHNNTLPERPPTFNNSDEMHKPVVKPAGNMVRLRCPSFGNPRPNITWLKNNEEPKRSLGTIIRTKWTLRLEDLVPDDSGNYTCIVCNRLGCINHTFKVDIIETVRHRPILTRPPRNTTVVIGSNASMTCEVLSAAHRHLEWYHGYHTSFDTVNKTNQTVRVEVKAGIVENPEELKLYNVTEKDEGWYTCIAQNTLGETFSSAYLRVVQNKEISRESLEGVNENQDGGARKYNVTLEEKSLNMKMMERKEKASTKYKDFKSQLKEKTMKKTKQEDHRMENSNEKEVTKLKACDQKSSKEKEKKKEKGEVEEEYQFYKNFIIAKLRKMNPKQRLYAENLINRVLYEGSVERLSLSTTITLQPYDYYNHQQLQGAGGIVNTIKEEKHPTLTTFDLI